MNRWRFVAVLSVLALLSAAFLHFRPARHASSPDGEIPESYPSDWFGAQRAWPLDRIPQERYRAAVEQALAEREAAARTRGPGTSLGPLSWTEAGPYNIGGRVTALAATPGGVTVYLGAAAGGVFKSTNSGVNWTPIFDRTGVFSIGALAIDPADSQTVYVGTGEANSSVDSYDGNGVYKTTDGGATWSSVGLEATARIGRIAVDPLNPQRVYAAAMGTQFSTNSDRGLYRSENGGTSWTKVHFVNDSVGVCDVVIHPTNPAIVYCATWERVRRNTYRRAYGPGSGIWKSTDFGASWTRLQTGLPAPSDSVGRIGLAISKSSPNTVYAQIISGTNLGYVGLGLYRTTDGGTTWTKRDLSTNFRNGFGGFGWYFGDMAVHPTNANRVYCLGQVLLRSLDGGANHTDITGAAHVDFHAFWIDPANPNHCYTGSDGGFFWSNDGGTSWSKSLDLPITQFYAGTIDPTTPARVMGGTQDNGTLQTYTGGTDNWIEMGLGGDGFQVVVDPVSGVIFAEYQFCCYGTGPRRSTNGGVSFAGAPAGFNSGDRYNWNTPIAMNPLNHNLLLVGSHRVYRSLNNGLSYSPISGDLTTNPGAALVYGTITTLDVSPADTTVYYAGTDDGRVWRSTDRGAIWTNVSAGLPVRYVTRVVAHPTDPDEVLVTLSGFGSDESTPHVYRSENRGDAWTPIFTTGLPDVPVNDLIVDPDRPSTLYLATDVGVYWTQRYDPADLVSYLPWTQLGWDMPIQSVLDLTFHRASRTLVAATHGRSQWRLDLSSVPVAVDPPRAAPRIALSPPAPNPASGSVRFTLELPQASATRIAIYDERGRRVRTVFDASLQAGTHVFTWDGRDGSGRVCRAGVFFARASAGGALASRRIVRVR